MEQERPSASGPTRKQKIPISELKVLVVDDSQVVRSLVRSALREMGLVSISEAANGLEAMRKLRRERYGLIISDWNMPHMTGLQLLIDVRTGDWHRRTPFIMLTAEGNKENVIAAIKQGATAYIVKPFTADTIQAKIAQIFGMAA
jgi:two-component system chemotaxis response regulator CheY